jgi:MGT family glycosyltransferase
MARYLAYTSPARGHLYPLVDTLLELDRRGQEVHVRTLASEVLRCAPRGSGPTGSIRPSSSSEFQHDDALITTALTALGSDDVDVVVTTAAHDPAGFRPPANARLADWLPHGPVVQQAACVVCHGGMGITQKALAAGVPVCVVPFGRDQFDVAHRVAALEAGTMVPPSELSPRALRTAIRQTMTLRAGAERVAAGFASAGGAAAAAGALQSLLTRSNAGTGPHE